MSWRALFWLNAPLAALGALCASRTVENRDRGAARTVGWAGLCNATAALAALASLSILVDRGIGHGPFL
ncbi:hypothetical protein GCM10018785_04960 [Streptomyces longispororuber]|uniref:Uncharacterized protein n=1 Tax=Streptomyces longispororuber TaxID=68230 RepID=A0A919DDB8_9ACTN|nr:hypothetical protein [Streptomyces longispororuber]GHE38330.1 hypothetical protein GCM10018785_04960 [Streptomyces longispororuber]